MKLNPTYGGFWDYQVSKGDYEACCFTALNDGTYAVNANGVLCSAVVDDFGNLVRVN